jgi:hypothetical protein
LTIWNILLPFGIIYTVCGILVYTYFPVLVSLDQEKSGNPGLQRSPLLNIFSLSAVHGSESGENTFYRFAARKLLAQN